MSSAQDGTSRPHSLLGWTRVFWQILWLLIYCHVVHVLCLGFTLVGTVKILDFGLARLLENANVKSNEVYAMSGETGSLRYMAPGTSCQE